LEIGEGVDGVVGGGETAKVIALELGGGEDAALLFEGLRGDARAFGGGDLDAGPFGVEIVVGEDFEEEVIGALGSGEEPNGGVGDGGGHGEDGLEEGTRDEGSFVD
jgi:hypothetical protein